MVDSISMTRQKGIRMINGQEYMLNGRYSDKEQAQKAADELRYSWSKVRVIKLWECDYMIYVHGAK